MKAIILAAGKGTRLKPLTYGIPKPLLPVGGRPVIDYVIENLLTANSEIDEIVVAVSYMKENIENYLKHAYLDGPKIQTVTTLGWDTGGDLRTILIEKGLNEPVIVAYGDNITKIDIGQMLAFHKKNGRLATVALFQVPQEEVSRFGIVELDGDRITSFTEKPAPGTAKSNIASAGYYILEQKALDLVPYEKVKVESSLFPLLASKNQLSGYIYHPPYWLDIGTIESYRKANKMMEGILPPG